MNRPKILVTAAAGHTGTAAVHQLLQMGFPVRAFVRRRDDRATALEQAGAELFIGDVFDYRDLRASMVGVQRAYHCPPFGLNLLHNTMLFAVAAEEARLEVVALMSQWTPQPSHSSVITREHWLSNQVYRWMPSVDVVHINPGIFAFMYLLGLPAAAHFGMLMAPFGDGLNAPPSNDDIARVATGVLADPANHIGKSYRPTGPELVSPQDIAGILGKVLGRKVGYKDVPFKTFSKAAVAQGFSLTEIAHMRHYAEDIKNGAFAVGGPTDHVLAVSGQEPEDFETIARRYINDPSLIHPAVKIGSKTEAVGFLVRMLATKAPDLDSWERDRGYPLLSNPVLSQDSAEWRATAERQQLNLRPVAPSATPKLELAV
ncbi:MAG: NmrA family NAD(P)-binding protein [Alphaproteobacteria bacterium]|nr:NmrA family NAD(P)-binding protein [Alphaproteobacteria bacterium]